jgi:hypothetical protein
MKRCVLAHSTVAVLALASLSFGVAPAVAVNQGSSPSPFDTLTSHTEASPERELRVMDDVAAVATSDSGDVAIESEVYGTEIVVPVVPVDPLTVTDGHVAVAITLPFSDVAQDAEVLTPGAVAYDNENGSVTAAVVKSDGVLQIATVIDGPAAPTEYAYEFSPPPGYGISIEANAVIVRSDIGDFAGVVSPAWARDADGAHVPTWYEVRGNLLTQVVQHSPAFAYPIVADPTYSPTLFTRATVDSYQGKPRVNLTPGWWTYTMAAPLMDVEGWNEATTQWGTRVRDTLLSKGTMRQQFSCHAYGSWFAGEWNLEQVRPTRTVHWSRAVASHRCNWVTATER